MQRSQRICCRSPCILLAQQPVHRVLDNRDFLSHILGNVTDALDLTCCSLINRTWRAATLSLQPAEITIRFPSDDYWNCYMINWLQLCQKRGSFSKFGIIQVHVDTDHQGNFQVYKESIAKANFWQPLLGLAGLWPLHTCCLNGDFDWQQAMLLLPTSLHCLELFPYDPTPRLQFWNMHRFKHLEHFDISLEGESLLACNRDHRTGVLVNAKHYCLNCLTFGLHLGVTV